MPTLERDLPWEFRLGLFAWPDIYSRAKALASLSSWIIQWISSSLPRREYWLLSLFAWLNLPAVHSIVCVYIWPIQSFSTDAGECGIDNNYYRNNLSGLMTTQQISCRKATLYPSIIKFYSYLRLFNVTKGADVAIGIQCLGQMSLTWRYIRHVLLACSCRGQIWLMYQYLSTTEKVNTVILEMSLSHPFEYIEFPFTFCTAYNIDGVHLNSNISTYR